MANDCEGLHAAASATAGRAPCAGGEPLRVMVVEDQQDLRELLADVVRSTGAEVVIADNANTAVALLGDGYRCDVLFTDIHMPGTLSGAQLAEHVARTLPQATLILASGHPRSQLPPLPAGTLFLQKPFRLGQFMALLDTAEARAGVAAAVAGGA